MKSMDRLQGEPVTFKRVASGLVRRLADLPQAFAWRYSAWAEENRARLAGFQDIHRDERCFVMGNGPSLAKMDLSPLVDEYSIGMNRIYLNFERMPFEPSYYAAINELVLDQFAEEISSLAMPKFVNWANRKHFKGLAGVYYLRMRLGLRDDFQGDARRPLASGGTVTYAALQLAYFMGFAQVVLIGVDHRFADRGTPNQVETRPEGADANHFHPNYFPPGSRWQLPDLIRSELAYTLARRAFEADGRQIVDATVNGACPVFEKAEFASLF